MAKRHESIGCPACGGRAVYETRTDTVEYKGQTAPVKVAGYWCAKCGEAVLDGDALEKREQAFLGLRANVEGVLSPTEVTSIRERLKLSQRRAGELLGGGPRAFQKYESGSQQVSVPMANLLRLLDKDPRRLSEIAKARRGSRSSRARASARTVRTASAAGRARRSARSRGRHVR
jgi:HTH-type transcriptional regulator/antitoxin MqsA